jgi:hypothetical protein
MKRNGFSEEIGYSVLHLSDHGCRGASRECERSRLARVCFDAGPLSEWLGRALTEVGFPVYMETRQVKAALSAMLVKAIASIRVA